MPLQPNQRNDLIFALKNDFNPETLESMLWKQLNRRIYDVINPTGTSYPKVVEAVVDAAEQEGWTWSLIEKAIADNSNGPHLKQFIANHSDLDPGKRLPSNPDGNLHIERVTDPNSEDLHEALDLYDQRIPEHAKFEAPDIIRWIRDDLENIEKGALRPRDFFLIAKAEKQVYGFLLLHYYPEAQLAFIAYLVAAKDPPLTNYSRDGISKRLLAEVRSFIASGRDLEACRGLLLEVDRPETASTEAERLRRLARIKLFCMLAEAQGFSLRAFDMDYHQPPLSLSNPDKTEPLLLMYANPKTMRPSSFVNSTLVRRILKFIYTDLYPEGYSDVPSENRAYKSCLRKICVARSKTLPKRITMFDFRQIKDDVMKKIQCVK